MELRNSTIEPVNAVNANRYKDEDEDGRPIKLDTLCVVDRSIKKLAKLDGSLRIAVINVHEQDIESNGRWTREARPLAAPSVGIVMFDPTTEDPYHLIQQNNVNEFWELIQEIPFGPLYDSHNKVQADFALYEIPSLDTMYVDIETIPFLRLRVSVVTDEHIWRSRWIRGPDESLLRSVDYYLAFNDSLSNITVLGEPDYNMFLILKKLPGERHKLFAAPICSLCCDDTLCLILKCGHMYCRGCFERQEKSTECCFCKKPKDSPIEARYSTSVCAVDGCVRGGPNVWCAFPCGCIYGTCQPAWNYKERGTESDNVYVLQTVEKCLRCRSDVLEVLQLYQQMGKCHD